MRPTELLQEIRKMRFEQAYEGWNAGGLTQAEAAQILGMCERSFRRYLSRYETTNRTHQDYMTPAARSDWLTQKGAQPRATVMDTSGAIGKLYSARTTPHMYVVDPKGQLVYAGAIDDKRGTDPSEVKSANNYVRLALSEAMSNKPLSNPATSPYGCAVKY